MRNAARIFVLFAALALAAATAGAKGGSMQRKVNKDFRELIVKGERPEITACLAAAVDYVRRHPAYNAVRWDDDASDRAIMNESELGGRLTRHVRLVTQMRIPGANPFAEGWRSMEVLCEQPESGEVRVDVKPVAAGPV